MEFSILELRYLSFHFISIERNIYMTPEESILGHIAILIIIYLVCCLTYFVSKRQPTRTHCIEEHCYNLVSDPEDGWLMCDKHLKRDANL